MLAGIRPAAHPIAVERFFTGAQRLIDTRAGEPVLSRFDLAHPLVLLDLTGSFATTLGASTAIHSGSRPRARRWARQLHEAYPSTAGLLAYHPAIRFNASE